MKTSISGYKDTDREILLTLSDKDLLAACSTNKYLFNSVCDDNFFHKKLLRSYPDSLKYYNKNALNYKQYYLTVVYHVSKLKEEFDYTYNSGNPETQYYIFKKLAGRLNYTNEDLLFNAAMRGELELVKEAIKRGVNIHSRDEEGLRTAASHGHLDVVKYLVSLGANIHIFDEHSLRWAAAFGHLEVVKYLVSLGADISADNRGALRFASEEGHLDIVEYLTSL